MTNITISMLPRRWCRAKGIIKKTVAPTEEVKRENLGAGFSRLSKEVNNMSLTKAIVVAVGSILATEAIKSGYEYLFESDSEDKSDDEE